MKKLFTSLLLAATTALSAQAQAPVKILVIDMAKIYNGHYQTEEQNAKLRADEAKAQDDIAAMNQQGNQLVEQYKEFADQTNNPVSSAADKAKAAGEAQKRLDQIQQKKQEIGAFAQNVQEGLRQRLATFRSMLFEDIGRIATDIAKRKGATLLIDKSGPSYLGVPVVVYSDPSLDITDEVIAEIAKTKPAAGAAPTPSAAPAAGSGPKITVPSVGK